MDNLILYTGKAPNTNGLYAYFTSFSAYMAYLSSRIFTSITQDKFIINNGTVRIAVDNVLTIDNYKNVTYMINEIDNKCYIVNRVVVQSGYVIFAVTLDLWGTFIADADFEIINVARCNRRIAAGLYDAIRATNTVDEVRLPVPADDYPTGYPDFYKLERIYIVFTLVYNVEQSAFGATSATSMFALNAKTLFDAYRTLVEAGTPSGQTPSYENAIDVITGIVGGIYGVEASNFWVTTQNDAKVTKAYLLPADLIYTTGSSGITVKSKSLYGTYTNLVCLDVAHFARYHLENIEIDANYEYYVGTVNKGLKLVRTTDQTATVIYKCIPSANNIEVVVMQGDNQLDITSEFEVTLTLNNGDVTNLAGIKQALSMGLKGATAVTTTGTVGLTSLAPDVIGLIGRHYQGQQNGNGDGVLNFIQYGNATLYLCARYPFGYVRYKSINDEHANALRKGAFVDDYVSSFASIFDYPLLYGAAASPTYVQANVNLSNIPLEAQDAIKTALSSGIYLINV